MPGVPVPQVEGSVAVVQQVVAAAAQQNRVRQGGQPAEGPRDDVVRDADGGRAAAAVAFAPVARAVLEGAAFPAGQLPGGRAAVQRMAGRVQDQPGQPAGAGQRREAARAQAQATAGPGAPRAGRRVDGVPGLAVGGQPGLAVPLDVVAVGLRLGATVGLINTVVAELYTAVSGLGGLLALYGNTFQMAPYFVVVLMLALVGAVVTQILRRIETHAGRWRGSAAP